MRTGDTVKHIKSGELWTVAWADERELMPCGWPEGFAKISDCELVEACSDEEHWKLVEEIARPSPGESDGRTGSMLPPTGTTPRKRMPGDDAPVTWHDVLAERSCPVCGQGKSRAPLCPSCELLLPRRVQWKLSTATRRWFVRWWWLACACLRTGRCA